MWRAFLREEMCSKLTDEHSSCVREAHIWKSLCGPAGRGQLSRRDGGCWAPSRSAAERRAMSRRANWECPLWNALVIILVRRKQIFKITFNYWGKKNNKKGFLTGVDAYTGDSIRFISILLKNSQVLERCLGIYKIQVIVLSVLHVIGKIQLDILALWFLWSRGFLVLDELIAL